MHRIAITMGDPSGIGAEVVLKALAESREARPHRCYVFGDAAVLYESSRILGMPFSLPVVSLEAFRQRVPDQSCVVDFNCLPPGLHRFGVEDARFGAASMRYIEEATTSCLRHRLDALVTAPINKKSINLAGYHVPGHTEFLAQLSGTERFLMSFYTSGNWTVLSTTHMPLSEAVRQVKKDHLVSVIRLAWQEIRRYHPDPRLAVAALNPHGAEGGLFGMEESMEILPAVEDCRAEGIPVMGPYSADTVFLRLLKGDCNVVITHYHDQGMIPVKLLSFGKAVNITLGLPFLRTSVDHGTAFDIAGRGLASAESMAEALRVTVEILDHRGQAEPLSR